MRKSLRRRGSALALTLVLLVLLTGIGAAFAALSTPFIKTTAWMNEAVLATYAAEAGLEKAWYDMATNGDTMINVYNGSGNVWLMSHSSATGFPAYTDLPIQVGTSNGQPYQVATVTVTIFSLDATNTRYRFVSKATVDKVSRTIAQDVKARDTFARYMFFTDASQINFGTSEVHGEVHSNVSIGFNFGGAIFHNDVSAVRGYAYGSGATPANTRFMAGSNPNAPVIPLPPVANIASLQPQASGAYNISGNATITLLGDQVQIKIGSGPTNTYPAPSNGLIYVSGDVTLKGDTSSRISIATPGNINVTDKIRYKDAGGNLAYTLNKFGVPQPNNQGTPGQAWTAANGYEYVPNPNYRPAPGQEPSLGLMAGGGVTIAASAPQDMEMHAANYAAGDRWKADLTYKKGNLRVLGSVVQRFGGWRYNSAGYGYALSGEYLYDNNLLNNPPPFFMNLDKPVKGGRYSYGTN